MIYFLPNRSFLSLKILVNLQKFIPQFFLKLGLKLQSLAIWEAQFSKSSPQRPTIVGTAGEEGRGGKAEGKGGGGGGD